ncbi:MAG TPA: ABC transporter permease [Gemmatimonadales bacterium]|jgi:phospholipid/cholesterol/gamma-HCH transport system permease protein
MLDVIHRVRRRAALELLDALASVGYFSEMVWEMIRGLPEWRVWLPRTFEEAWSIGVGSLFIVILISAFTGGVTALQAGYQFTGNVPIYVVGSLVTESVVLELGPVLVGLILAGRIGARYAAELGTMRVTEQIDALESLGRSPSSYLLLPRVLACMLMIPVLVVFADVIALLAGWFVSRSSTGISNEDFTYGARAFWHAFDAWYSIIKAFFFAVSIALVSCYRGFTTRQGAEGVGKSTTGAVVTSSVLILLLDLLLAQLLLKK